MKGVNIFLAEGFEDIEALAVNDILRRGGVKVSLVAIGDEPFVLSSHGLMVGVDNFFPDMDADASGTGLKDVMIFPGGMPGSKNLAASKELVTAMKEHYAAGGTVAAICAAPGLVLGKLDCWENRAFTCYDGCEQLPVSKGGIFTAMPAVVDGQMITGRGPGYATDFAFEILRRLKGDAVADEVKRGMYLA